MLSILLECYTEVKIMHSGRVLYLFSTGLLCGLLLLKISYVTIAELKGALIKFLSNDSRGIRDF